MSINKITMNTERKIGIWMDHSTANLMEFTPDPIETTTLDVAFTHQEKEDSPGRSEQLMHNKEQQQQGEFYKKIGDAIQHYDAVLLFGPTNAKTELLHTLRADHRFGKIRIDVQPADKMTENQQHAFVKKHFTTHTSTE